MKPKSLSYLEYPSRSLPLTKAFFSQVFGWSFTDYGDQYTAFSLENVDGGFYLSDTVNDPHKGGALTVFYSDKLNEIREEIEQAGGVISQGIFAFPGGHRFHFKEPGGSEFAVWSDCHLE
ncbi:VOC family protein [Alteromonas sp. C1M14]|nr:VOC family protein [Alteromonas sp. C1M14]